ncbi:DUF5659 domain-containing protein [Faecalibacillus intestinalis]|uniref:DUF5659 domain-containing protein n=1 Tax=Faecalibacillus intestinalis TaxID=1982626 RepID=UPI0039A10025|nr:hypothetical protein [Coprobacillus sp.]
MNNYFYCYSKRLAHFIMAFGIRYKEKSVNQNSQMPYYKFEKSKRMDQIIELYKKVIHTI